MANTSFSGPIRSVSGYIVTDDVHSTTNDQTIINSSGDIVDNSSNVVIDVSTGAVAVTSADGLTVNSVIVPQSITASHHAQAAGALVDQTFWICPAADNYQITGIDFVHAVAETTAANLRVQVTKDNGTEAPGAGNNLLTNNTNAGFDVKATANTIQNGTLTATTADLQLTADDRLSVDYEAGATEGVGVTITVTLKRIA